MTILSGKARLAGIIGWPVEHSRSPRLHGFWLERHGIDGAYVPLPIRPEAFALAVRGLAAARVRDTGAQVGVASVPLTRHRGVPRQQPLQPFPHLSDPAGQLLVPRLQHLDQHALDLSGTARSSSGGDAVTASDHPAATTHPPAKSLTAAQPYQEPQPGPPSPKTRGRET